MSTSLIDAKCYPPERGPLQSPKAIEAWRAHQSGATQIEPAYGQVRSWFRTYDEDDLLAVNVREEYLALNWRDDLLMFLTISEDELADAQQSEDDVNDDD